MEIGKRKASKNVVFFFLDSLHVKERQGVGSEKEVPAASWDWLPHQGWKKVIVSDYEALWA